MIETRTTGTNMTGTNKTGISKIRAWVIAAVLLLLILVPQPTVAVRGFTERDKQTDERIRTEGFLPVLFNPYTISATDRKWDEQVAYLMSRDSAVLVEIAPTKEAAGVIMLVGNAGSGGLRAAWADDHVSRPVRLWTNRYWLSSKQCDANGCPRIVFKATKGTLTVTVLDKRP
jgi:hypothetical protein